MKWPSICIHAFCVSTESGQEKCIHLKSSAGSPPSHWLTAQSVCLSFCLSSLYVAVSLHVREVLTSSPKIPLFLSSISFHLTAATADIARRSSVSQTLVQSEMVNGVHLYSASTLTDKALYNWPLIHPFAHTHALTHRWHWPRMATQGSVSCPRTLGHVNHQPRDKWMTTPASPLPWHFVNPRGDFFNFIFIHAIFKNIVILLNNYYISIKRPVVVNLCYFIAFKFIILRPSGLLILSNCYHQLSSPMSFCSLIFAHICPLAAAAGRIGWHMYLCRRRLAMLQNHRTLLPRGHFFWSAPQGISLLICLLQCLSLWSPTVTCRFWLLTGNMQRANLTWQKDCHRWGESIPQSRATAHTDLHHWPCLHAQNIPVLPFFQKR